jgi:hypothetical protein
VVAEEALVVICLALPMQQEVAVVDRHLEFNEQHVLLTTALLAAAGAVVEVLAVERPAAKAAVITAAAGVVVGKAITVVVVGAVAMGTLPVTAVVPVLPVAEAVAGVVTGPV